MKTIFQGGGPWSMTFVCIYQYDCPGLLISKSTFATLANLA